MSCTFHLCYSKQRTGRGRRRQHRCPILLEAQRRHKQDVYVGDISNVCYFVSLTLMCFPSTPSNQLCYRNMNTGKIVEEKIGDLFEAPQSMALGHCISADNLMGGSLFAQFRRGYQGFWDMEKGRPTVGSLVVVKEHGRVIYNLITKEKFYDYTTLTNLHMCLQEMRNHMIQNHIIQLGLPRLGCGHDRLLWNDVYTILVNVFRCTSIKVTVFSLT